MLYLFFSLAREEGLRTVVYFSITIRKRARTKEKIVSNGSRRSWSEDEGGGGGGTVDICMH